MTRYLPLIRPDGSWIERPDLFLLARMGYEDEIEMGPVKQVYETMLRSDHASSTLNALEDDIVKRHLGRKMQDRLFAGQTLLELVRIAATTQRPPSATQAIRLAAHNHHQYAKRSSPESLEREVRKGFAAYRSTAHFQAAALLEDPGIDEVENSAEGLNRFLSRARGLEIFVDRNVLGGSFKWDPWRVPECVEANFRIEISPLSTEERAYLGLS